MFVMAELIKNKRNGQALSDSEIRYLIESYTSDAIPDYQMSAMLMAIYFKGMNPQETLSLTKAMLHSGVTVDFSDLADFKVDKHSTGGVGDKTSLILGPIVAAAGLAVPMISGRGLGHTGGTLDKLESIPVFNTQFSLDQFRQAIIKNKICFIGQTKEICPADKKIYALRDVTGTVESLPLICASILSKKLAEGIDGLVLDVKFGSGAFMKSKEKAQELALALMAIAQGYGKKVTAILSNMDQPLGEYAGNSLEIKECLDILKGQRSSLMDETRELSLQLSAHMMLLSGQWKSFEEAYQKAEMILQSGQAYQKFIELCQLHGADINKLPLPKNKFEIRAQQSGWISGFDTENIGMIGVRIGAGRLKTSDLIEPTAGIQFHAKVGAKIQAGDLLYTLWGANTALLAEVAPLLEKTIHITNENTKPQALIWKVLQ